MILRSPLLLAAASLAALALPACSGSEDPQTYELPARSPGDRAPLTAPCDAMDTMRCMLPWPSSTFMAKDPKTATGLRVAVDPASLFNQDDPWSANLADGFSRATPIVTGFPARIAPIPPANDGDGPVRLILAQHDHPGYGSLVPLRFEVNLSPEEGVNETLLVGYPLAPLEPNADYVAVVMDTLPVESGSPPEASREALLALGRADAHSPEEAKIAAYHAPSRAALEKAGVDPARAVRVWDFTTRSQGDATKRLRAMRDAAASAVSEKKVGVTIDAVTTPSDSAIAAIVEGKLTGLPSFASSDLQKGLTLDDNEMPVATGAREAPFRVMIPAGTGDYRFVLFGHGMGGSYHDDLFDHELASSGTAKVNIQFHGWTEDDVIETFVNFTKVFIGAHHSSALLMQAVADGEAIQKAMLGPIGDALAAADLGGMPNPAAGRRPQFDVPVWAGGSLGGTMGLVFASSAKETYAGVLNVPGAGWTHFIPTASTFGIISALLINPYQGDLNVLHAMAMSQGVWDDIDGAVWAAELKGRGSVFLVQESIGDPVLPNAGSEMVAVVTEAVQVGEVLSPILGVTPAATPAVEGQTALTQYLVPDTDEADIHGFAARDTPAGDAAREQIQSFLVSVYDKKPKITVPSGCKGGSCNFKSP